MRRTGQLLSKFLRKERAAAPQAPNPGSVAGADRKAAAAAAPCDVLV